MCALWRGYRYSCFGAERIGFLEENIGVIAQHGHETAVVLNLNSSDRFRLVSSWRTQWTGEVLAIRARNAAVLETWGIFVCTFIWVFTVLIKCNGFDCEAMERTFNHLKLKTLDSSGERVSRKIT